MIDTLQFDELRAANVDRDVEWTASSGVRADLSFRAMELGGEVGEALNEAKKLVREANGWPGSRSSKAKLAEELADVVICADLMAMELGIDLGWAVRSKFNATSNKVGLTTKL